MARPILLEMVEALIVAHKAAKFYGEEKNLALIEAALFYAGEQLREKFDRDEFGSNSEKRGGGDNSSGPVSGSE